MTNKDNLLNDIKHYIEEGEMSFLIGAGFSRNVNEKAYPLWGELLKDAIWNLFGSGNRAKQENKVLEKAVKEHGYLGIASMIVKKAGYHEAIDTYIESKTPYLKSEGKKSVLMLNGEKLPNSVNPECHLLLKKLDIQNIYTFNYDNALEYFMGEDAKQEFNKIERGGFIRRAIFKYRRWQANAWKHELCFNESMSSAFWSGVKSHLLKPSSI